MLSPKLLEILRDWTGPQVLLDRPLADPHAELQELAADPLSPRSALALTMVRISSTTSAPSPLDPSVRRERRRQKRVNRSRCQRRRVASFVSAGWRSEATIVSAVYPFGLAQFLAAAATLSALTAAATGPAAAGPALSAPLSSRSRPALRSS